MLLGASIGCFGLTLGCYVATYTGSNDALWALLFAPLAVAVPLGASLGFPRAVLFPAAMLVAGLGADALRAMDLIQMPSASYDELGALFFVAWSAFLTALFALAMIVTMLLRPSTWRPRSRDQTTGRSPG